MNTNKKKHNNQKSKRVVSGKTSKIGLSITRIISTKFSARQTKKRNLSITQGTELMVADLVRDNSSVSPLVVDKPLVKECFYEQCLKVLDPDLSIEGIDFNLRIPSYPFVSLHLQKNFF